jgi:hypothetical protein
MKETGMDAPVFSTPDKADTKENIIKILGRVTAVL